MTGSGDRVAKTFEGGVAALGPVYDVDGVARLIGGAAPVTRQAVSKRRLLALKTGSGRVQVST